MLCVHFKPPSRLKLATAKSKIQLKVEALSCPLSSKPSSSGCSMNHSPMEDWSGHKVAAWLRSNHETSCERQLENLA